jgi:flagellar assembly protein FliH
LIEGKAEEQRLLEKISSLEVNLTEAKNTSLQKEQEFASSVEAAKEQARSEGREQGHAEGLQSGRESGLKQAHVEVEKQYKEKFANLIAMLEGISIKLEEHFSELIALNQPRMLRLWLEMLKRMLRCKITLVPEAVFNLLTDVLSRVSDKNHIVIYVAPEDMELLQNRVHKQFEEALRGVKHLELKPDTNVEKGSCIVETNLGIYDARWRIQLDQVEMAVEKLFQQLGKTFRNKDAAGAPE